MDTPEGATVLLVDDNIELLELLARSLQHIGHFSVVQASDGASGLEQAVAVRPACMVVDVVMPGLDGFQLVRALRGDPATAGIPIVMLTALAQDRDQLAGLISGADRYLVKPVKLLDLIAAIRESIILSEVERQRRLLQLAECDGETGGNEEGGL
jgi:DNA-binding response OmpR family regulator